MKRAIWIVAAVSFAWVALTFIPRYVDVPEQINLAKRSGEPVTIELQKTAGKPKVLRAY